MPSSSPTISLAAAATLTGRSKRTLWRRLADGSLGRGPDDARGRATVWVEPLKQEGWPELALADWDTAAAADAGDAHAQAELALKLLEHHRDSAALYWLNLAVVQDHPDAMLWLSRCKLKDQPPDLPGAMVWLARAAAAGHPVAQAQMAGLQPWQPDT